MTLPRQVVVRVPATSANLGPGFDALGLALSLYDEVRLMATAGRLVVEVTGEGAADVPRDERHLVVCAMDAAFQRMAVPFPAGLEVRCHNRIPHGRGLGSSAAAICAGVLATRALVPDGRAALTDDDVFALAAELEGHPDNVAACLAGGLTIAWIEDHRPRLTKLDPLPSVAILACVPPAQLATDAARKLLPDVVPHGDAAANAGRAALLVAALTRDPRLLLPATADWLHTDYRAAAMPASVDLLRRLRARGLPAVLSGAGPTVLAFGAQGMIDSIADEVGSDWHIQPLNIDRDGARVHVPPTRDASSTSKE